MGKFGAGLLVTLEVYSTGAHWIESYQAHNQYLEVLKEIDVKEASENTKLELATKYTEHMHINAPHRSPVKQILGDQNMRTLGDLLSNYKILTSTK